MVRKKEKVVMPAGIRNKLMAAVSMLIVSAIMMVSSTYAWFTLSTVPEVKNITTTVAGNGSLEIALMPTSGLFKDLKSGFSSEGGTVAVTTANTSWGNVVQLSDTSYGLGTVSLNPAQLNLNTTDATKFANAANPLAVATYGFDGRVDKLDANTALRSYKEAAFKDETYGVRAIGVADEAGVLKDTYGYAVDLAFRLNTTNNTGGNAASGKLLLQTDAKQRIYNGENPSANAATQGGGSYMSFDINGTGLDLTQLMAAIRVTFVQNFGLSGAGETPTILGTAKLDTAHAVAGATETKVPLYLYKTSGEAEVIDTDAVLLPTLTKNQAAQVSAIVWVDGTMMKNSSVAAISTTLAKATLNLQFSTDVELKPANNNVLYQGNPTN